MGRDRPPNPSLVKRPKKRLRVDDGSDDESRELLVKNNAEVGTLSTAPGVHDDGADDDGARAQRMQVGDEGVWTEALQEVSGDPRVTAALGVMLEKQNERVEEIFARLSERLSKLEEEVKGLGERQGHDKQRSPSEEETDHTITAVREQVEAAVSLLFYKPNFPVSPTREEIQSFIKAELGDVKKIHGVHFDIVKVARKRVENEKSRLRKVLEGKGSYASWQNLPLTGRGSMCVKVVGQTFFEKFVNGVKCTPAELIDLAQYKLAFLVKAWRELHDQSEPGMNFWRSADIRLRLIMDLENQSFSNLSVEGAREALSDILETEKSYRLASITAKGTAPSSNLRTPLSSNAIRET
mmetsp:Transcript_11314/g.31746  ORF Transcript_11314/g.31746 Transcript_11314/m.31746 type:complete len:353 (+) Transcript_11314:124-1182(+)